MATAREALTEEELAVLKRAEAEKAERERYKDDRVISGFPHNDRIYVVTAMGRVFCRMLDGRGHNYDGRQTEKYLWRQVEAPF